MLSKLSAALREQKMIQPGETVIAAVSGGADSIALLFGLYLLKDTLHFDLQAAHFNHQLRGAESDADEAFVSRFCDRYDIPLTVGRGEVVSGEKGLEAAAREARYAFLKTLPGKIATAHTADDNAETLLMHLLRGSGLKGMGGIMPINGRIIRPMLTVTRLEVEAFLQEYYLSHIEDSSNQTDQFLRNRIRHKVMPLMMAENPNFAYGASQLAMRLRQDEEWIQSLLKPEMPGVSELRTLHPALRSRYLERFLKENGVREPEQRHIAMVNALVFTQKPSAKANLSGGVTAARAYDRLTVLHSREKPEPVRLIGAGVWELPQWGIKVTISPADRIEKGENCITAVLSGDILLRSRCSGDSMRLPGGTKSLKKAYIDRKIPADQRSFLPVLADGQGILLAAGLGPNLDRVTQTLPASVIRIEGTSENYPFVF